MDHLTELLTLLETHGLPLIISAGALLLAYRYLNELVSRHFKRPIPSTHTDRPDTYSIQSHSILSTLDYILHIGINRLFFTSRFKQVLFNDFLSIQFRVIKEQVKKCVEQTDINVLSLKKLETHLNSCFTEMITRSEETIRQELSPHFSGDTGQIEPAQVLLEKYNVRFEGHNHILFEAIKEFCSTSALQSNEQRLAAVLYALKSLSLLLMLDAERTFAEMNGDFAGWEYKGIKNTSERIGGTR